MAKRKHKTPHLLAKDVVFGTMVRNSKAMIVAQQGIVLLAELETDEPYFMPSGVFVPYELYNTEVEIVIRDISHEVILELNSDDYYEDDLEKDERIMPVDEWDEIEELYIEKKLQLLTKSMPQFSTIVSGIILAGVCIYLLFKEFLNPIFLVAGVTLGVVVSIFAGILPAVRVFKKLNSNIIVDGAGHYIDMKTGRTNLNGGMRIPLKQEK